MSNANIKDEAISLLCNGLADKNYIHVSDYEKYGVKRGLRNADGTGVMAGLTKICSVEGYYMNDGEKVPKEGHLFYRGIDINDDVILDVNPMLIPANIEREFC